MRENCTPGSEGGDGERRFLPLSAGQEATFASAPRKSFERQLLPRERPLILWWSKYSSRTKMRRENFLRDEEYSRLYFVLLLIEQHVPFALKVADRYAVSNVRMRPTNASAPISQLFSSTHTPISTPFSAPVASDESPRTGPSVQSPRTPCVHCRPVVPRFSACTATPIAGRRGAGGKTNQQPSSWRKNMIFKER